MSSVICHRRICQPVRYQTSFVLVLEFKHNQKWGQQFYILVQDSRSVHNYNGLRVMGGEKMATLLFLQLDNWNLRVWIVWVWILSEVLVCMLWHTCKCTITTFHGIGSDILRLREIYVPEVTSSLCQAMWPWGHWLLVHLTIPEATWPSPEATWPT